MPRTAVLVFAAALAAAPARAQDATQLVAQAKRRWAESPHGPMLERILPPPFPPRQLPNAKSRRAHLLVRHPVQPHHLPTPPILHPATPHTPISHPPLPP